jgi:Protein of unknown function, DUF488
VEIGPHSPAGTHAPPRPADSTNVRLINGIGPNLRPVAAEHGESPPLTSEPTIYTIGHSTRTEEELLTLLEEAGIRLVADVRAFPSSRRHPQFNRAALTEWLSATGIEYLHVPGLGGRRTPIPASPNGGWRESAFRGYADHMRSEEFQTAMAKLEAAAQQRPVAAMCAEAVWWRCHRRLIADALVVRGWRVEHLGIGEGHAVHELPSFAVVDPAGGTITYPPAQTTLLER